MPQNDPVNRSPQSSLTRRWVLRAGALAAASVAMPRGAGAVERTHVLVIGAGLAGLNAAIHLADAGADVTVLEANKRVGGRCYTGDVESKPEWGASQIGPMYARVRDMCGRLGVRLDPKAHLYAPYALSVGGSLMASAAWESSPLNRTAGDERKVPPSALYNWAMERFSPFTAVDQWLSPDAGRYDIAVSAFMRGNGVSEAALKLIGRGYPDLDTVSALTMLQEAGSFGRDAPSKTGSAGKHGVKEDIFQRASQTSDHVVGGTSRLPEAMAAFLGDRVHTGARVVALTQDKNGVEAVTANGKRVRADFVVFAIPFKALRSVKLTPALTGPQHDAVMTMPYSRNTQWLFRVKAPYWEQDGFDGSLWSDGGVTMWRQNIEYDGTRDTAVALLTGSTAEALDRMPQDAQVRYILKEMAKTRPSTEGKLEFIAANSWGNSAGIYGCRHQYAPGDVMRWRDAMIAPAGRIHFAGEHTRRIEVGMEAAMESGERAAIEIIEKI